MNYLGNFAIDSTVYLYFNTFDSNDPSASVTITNLVAGDVKIHKNGSTTERTSSAGITVSINFDTITGNHLISIDLSDNTDAGFYVAGDFGVRIEGTTIDAATINSFVGSFSIENRFTNVNKWANTAVVAGAIPAFAADTAGGLVVSDAGGLDIDSKLANTNEVTAARMAALTDWINGGRLDLILDIIAVDVANIDGAAMRGTDSANTVVPDAAGVAPTAVQNRQEMDSNSAQLTAIVTDTGTTLDTKLNDLQGATFNSATDSNEAIRDRGDSAWTTGAGGSDRLLMVDTTIATLASQISFTLTSGSVDNDAYNNCTIIVEDVSTSTQKAVGMVLDYIGSSKAITLKEALAFTITTTDKVYILAENSLKSTVKNRQLDVTTTGASGIDWGNVENKSTANDLSGTDIQLADTTTTNTDMRGTDSALTTKTGFSLSATGLDAIASTATGMVEIAKAIWDRVLTGGTHNINNSAGKRVRQQQESGNYALGLVWLDTVKGIAGTTSFENGTEVKPTNLLASANTILSALPLHGIHVAAGSSIAFVATQENQEITGIDWTLDLGGVSIDGSALVEAVIDGASIGVPGKIESCFLNSCTFAGGDFFQCAIAGTITLSGATTYHFFNCHNAGTAILDFGGAVANTTVNLHHYHGDIQISNLGSSGIDVLNITSPGGTLILNSNCVGGTVNISGTIEVVNNGSGMTINNLSSVVDVIGVGGVNLGELGGMSAAMQAEVNAEVDTALSDYNGPTSAEMVARTLPTATYFNATNDTVANVAIVASNDDMRGTDNALTDKAGFSLSTAGITAVVAGVWNALLSGISTAGSLGLRLKELLGLTIRATIVDTDFTPTTTQFECDLTNTVTDHYVGRLVSFDTGTLDEQQSDITASGLANGRVKLTVTAITSAPANGVKFEVL